MRTPGKKADGADADHLFTNTHAGTAQNTFAFVRIGHKSCLRFHAKFFGQFLQNLGFGAARQKQFHDQTTYVQNAVAFGVHGQSFFHTIETGRDDSGSVSFFNFHHTQTTGTGAADRLVRAEGGNRDTRAADGFQKHGSFRSRYIFSVNSKIYHGLSYLYFTIMDSNLQLSIHAPQRVHLLLSMV